MSPVPWGEDVEPGRVYVLEVAECAGEDGPVWRIGGLLPRDMRTRTSLWNFLIEAAQAALVDDYEPGRIAPEDPRHPWHPSRFDRQASDEVDRRGR